MVAVILFGVLAGCFATNAILGENPFQLVHRWREEDAGKLSSDVGDVDNQQNPGKEGEGDSTGDDAEPPAEKDQVPDDGIADGTQDEIENKW